MNGYFKQVHDKILLFKNHIADFPPHFHDEAEVIFVLSGTATAICNGETYSLSAGSILLVGPNLIHAYRDRSQDFCQYVMIINPGRLNKNTEYLLSQGIPESPVWQDSEKSSPVWQLIDIAYEIQQEISLITLQNLLSTIVSLILEKHTITKQTGSKHGVRSILEYCRLHYQEPISLKLLSDTLHFSQSYISHSFRRELNMSLPDYINGLRLNEAVRMLQNTNMSIADIAVSAGFPTARTFNRIFYQKYGISPSVFRKNRKTP